MSKFLFLFFILQGIIFSQDNTVDFLPSGLNFLPLRANNQEAKLGVLYYPNSTNLKVDIGNAIDLLKINFDPKEYLTFGVEFMAYAYSMSYSQMRLQIGAIDGFFGGNAVFNKSIKENNLKIRFRYIHNSAHLVDGYFSTSTNSWMNNTSPIPFTRDFGELLFTYENNSNDLHIRPYIGGSYAVRIRPSILKRSTFITGLETYSEASNKILSRLPYCFFGAIHFQLAGLPQYQGSTQIQAGIKFGNWNAKGVNFFLSYFKGNNMFNEFFREKIERFGVGFSVDF